MTAQDQPATRTKHRLSVADFLLLDKAGAFGDRRTELVDGEVFYMSPKHVPHARTVTKLVLALSKAIEGTEPALVVLTDVSVRLSEHDVPEPDLVVTDGSEGDGIVPLEAVRLVIEVADSTLVTDLGLKATLYATACVPEYWVVDVAGRLIYQMWMPESGTYARRREVTFGQEISSSTVEGLTVETAAS